uniref:Uncharacterized protein n=1 Tax=Daphnia galeata TaxID=27404 RepID=A0A8J2RUS1_9CRUS|nr:unnamed protein product [Daphnia galeata]
MVDLSRLRQQPTTCGKGPSMPALSLISERFGEMGVTTATIRCTAFRRWWSCCRAAIYLSAQLMQSALRCSWLHFPGVPSS